MNTPPVAGPRFVLVSDRSVPEETGRLLKEACASRGVPFVPLDAYEFDFSPDVELDPGDMLYKAAVALAAGRVEQFLSGDHVATLYDAPSRVHFDSMDPPLLLERSGVPIPRTFYCHTADRDVLRKMVDRLGGFPIVVKTPGGEGGVGTMRADSHSGLFSLVDYIRSRGTIPRLVAYVPDAVHWRAVVVGDRVVAAYPNETDADDFRTHAPADGTLYVARPDPTIEAVAVAATRAFGYEFGGVDVLRHPESGRLYVLEVNMPCYFPQAQLRGGIDVAGAMVDHLRAKSERIRQSR